MRIYKPIGSKDRLVEIFQNVNKVKLHEGLFEANSPNLNADNVLNMAFDQLKNKRLNVEHTNTETNGDESFVVLTCTDKQGNNITFTFHVVSTEGDQEGVSNINSITLNTFTFDSADGEDTIEMAEDSLRNFNQQHSQELYDVVPELGEVGEPVENGVQEAIDLIDAIKQQSYPFGGSPKDMQTGENYADQKPTNDSVRVKSPELDQFIQEDMTIPTKIRTIEELRAYREQLKAQGFKGLRKVDFPLLADQALHDMAIKLADRILPMGWDGLADVNSMWDYIRKDGGMTFEQVLKAVKKAVNVRLKEEGYDLKSLGLGESAEHERYSEYYQDILKRLKAYAEKNGFDPIALKDDFMQEADPFNMKTPKDRIDKFFEIDNEVLRADEPQQSIQEIDKPAMKLIQQAPGGATAGGVKQLEEKMNLPIVGGIGMGVNEVDIVGGTETLGTPKPSFPISTKSPVDDLPPEKGKIIMNAINALTRFKPDFAPSADQINTEILRQRNQPQVKENDGIEGADDEINRFYKEKDLATQHPEQISATAELEPEEPQPEIELGPEEIKLIYQAEENLIAKNSRNPNYSPTTDEIRAEMDNIKGIKKPVKKFRGASSAGEYYLSEVGTQTPPKLTGLDFEQVFDKVDPDSNIKQQIIQSANEFADVELGVKRFQMSPEEYKKLIKNVATSMYVAYMEHIKGLNEDVEKGEYPDPLGKKFKPKKHYPKKKKKMDNIVKLTEDVYSDDDIETPDLPIDTAVRRARGAERQATSDTNKEYGRQIDPSIEFQPELAEEPTGEQGSTGEELLKKEYENLRQNSDTFAMLSDAYISLLELGQEFKSDKKIQVSLANIRDTIVEFLNMSDMPVTQQGVQDFFENDLNESLYEDKEPGAEVPETDPDKTGPDVTSEPSIGSMEKLPDDGMSNEPETDQIAQLAQDKEEQGEILQGGKGDGKSPLEFDSDQVIKGLEVEKEHTDDPLAAIEIVLDHLTEDPEYYTQKDTPEASAQAGASADAGEENPELNQVEKDNPDLYPPGWKEMDGMFMNPENPMYKKMHNMDNDKEMTDRLLGYKPHNVGDEVEEPKVDESMSVADEKGLAQTIVNTPRPETGLVKEDNEKDIKERDPATWHQIQIAKKTLKMPGAMAGVMGGMSKEEAKEILRKRGIKFDEK